MIVVANLNKEVYEYFEGYDLSAIANYLMEIYDFTALPATTGDRYKEVRVEVTHPLYITMYRALGPRSNKVSLARLFEFAYHLDIKYTHDLSEFTQEAPQPVDISQQLSRAKSALRRAWKETSDEDIKDVIGIISILEERYK